MSKYEDRGFSPIVHSPFRPRGEHRSVEIRNSVFEIEVPKEDCVMIALQSSGGNSIRFTMDGSMPSKNRGFILFTNMPPMIFNMCGITTKLKFISESGKKSILEYQLGE